MKAYQKPAVEIENIFSDNVIAADGYETLLSFGKVPAWGELMDSLIK